MYFKVRIIYLSTANKLGSLFRRLLHEHSSNREMKKNIYILSRVFLFLFPKDRPTVKINKYISVNCNECLCYKNLLLLKLDTAFVILLFKKNNNTYTSSHKKYYIQRISVKKHMPWKFVTVNHKIHNNYKMY